MANPFNGPTSRLWIRWKSLNLPWRKQRLAGWDLHGNTFWEFKDTVRSNRWRRIARQPRGVIDYADIAISPQWHQWLRHTRPTAPSLAEQQADVQRQIQLKELVRLADQRWSAKTSYLQQPTTAAPAVAAPASGAAEGEGGVAVAVAQVPGRKQGESEKAFDKENPWEKHRQVREDWQSGGEWKPEQWKPGGR